MKRVVDARVTVFEDDHGTMDMHIEFATDDESVKMRKRWTPWEVMTQGVFPMFWRSLGQEFQRFFEDNERKLESGPSLTIVKGGK